MMIVPGRLVLKITVEGDNVVSTTVTSARIDKLQSTLPTTTLGRRILIRTISLKDQDLRLF